MLVSEWMSRDLVTLAPEDPVARAADTMARHRVRRIPIVSQGELLGIVTKSDVLRAAPPNLNPFSAAARSDPALAGPVEAIMTRPAVTIAGESPLEAAAQLMVDRRIGGVPATLAGRLAGMLTESDIFRAFTAGLVSREPGLRITIDVSRASDPVAFAVEIARRHRLRVGSVLPYVLQGQRRAVVRLVGAEPPGLVDELWQAGHRVLSVIRIPPS